MSNLFGEECQVPTNTPRLVTYENDVGLYAKLTQSPAPYCESYEDGSAVYAEQTTLQTSHIPTSNPDYIDCPKQSSPSTPRFRSSENESIVYPRRAHLRQEKRNKERLKISKASKLKHKKIENEVKIQKPREVSTPVNGIFKLHVCNNKGVSKKETNSEKSMCDIHNLPPLKECDLYSAIPEEWFERKVWNTLCNHTTQIGPHSKEEYFRRIIKWRKGYSQDISKDECILCDLQNITSKPIRSNVDQFEYTHDFYNKYSRRRLSKNATVGENVLQNIQPFRGPQKCAFPPLTPDGSLQRNPSNSPSPIPKTYSNIVSPCSMIQSNCRPKSTLSGGDRCLSNERGRLSSAAATFTTDSEYTPSRAERLQNKYITPRKAIHRKCQPRTQQVQLHPERVSSTANLVYKRKAFKGHSLKKEIHVNERPAERSTQKSYEVEKLGLSFNLPDFNPNLGNRHVSIPKSFTHVPGLMPNTANTPKDVKGTTFPPLALQKQQPMSNIDILIL